MNKYSLKNKKITIMGLGLHGGGLGVAKYLVRSGAKLLISDIKTKKELKPSLDQLKDFPNISYHLGGHSWNDFKNADMVFVNQAVNLHSPIIRKIKKARIPISNEMILFFELCPSQIIGVTGTNGKSTTVQLIYEILKNNFNPQNRKIYLGGNIGISLLEQVEEMAEKDLVILELSSFQLEFLTLIKKSPHISIILNITPDHLDKHRNLEEYIEAKKNIIRFQNHEDFAILNYDDQNVKRFAKSTKAKILYFSRKLNQKSGSFLRNDYFWTNFRGNLKQYSKKQKIKIIGEHNYENILASILVGAIYNVKSDIIKQVLKNFRGLPHRIQYVKKINGVKYFNDSKATTPISTVAALNSFDKKVILLAGGFDKKLELEKLAKEIINHSKTIILFGEMAKRLEKTILRIQSKFFPNEDLPIFQVNDLEKAVKKAYQISESSDIVLLSPSTSSLDQFRDFEERGKKFCLIVRKLAKEKGE